MVRSSPRRVSPRAPAALQATLSARDELLAVLDSSSATASTPQSTPAVRPQSATPRTPARRAAPPPSPRQPSFSSSSSPRWADDARGGPPGRPAWDSRDRPATPLQQATARAIRTAAVAEERAGARVVLAPGDRTVCRPDAQLSWRNWQRARAAAHVAAAVEVSSAFASQQL